MSEVWLEIADAEANGSDRAPALDLFWRVHAAHGSARVGFKSPITASVARQIAGDMQRFRSWHPAEHDHAQSLERTLLTLGRALGNALAVDPDYSLVSFREWLERDNSLAALRVCVRTNNPAVAAVPWELMILPDSPYVLAAAAGAFVRAPVLAHPLEDMHAQPPKVLGLGGGSEHALGYLRLDGGSGRPGLQLEDLWKALTWRSALRVGLGPAPGWTSVLPEPGEQSWHIVHWCGEITREHGELCLSLRVGSGAARTLAAASFFSVIRALGAELVILEATVGGELLHELAAAAVHADIPNALVVGEQQRQAWPSRWLNHLLECLGDGLGLQQAVVETRKRMQRARVEARQAEIELPHAQACAHLLVHYSTRDVVFFASPQQRAPEDRAAHPALFGFERVARAPELGDAAALMLFDALTAHGAVLVYAAQGGGLTHSLQRVARLALVTTSVQHAYGWDFARERYSVGDVLEMVAGTRGETDPQNVKEQDVLASLAQQRALFVFDNVDVLVCAGAHDGDDSASSAALDELLALVRRIHEAGGLCLLGTHRPLSAHGLPPALELPPISEHDCIAISAARRLSPRALGPKFLRLTQELQGLPLLIQRVFAECSASNVEERLREVSSHFGASHARAQLVERFYAHRFAQLAPHWQRLLAAWAPLGGVYLQLLMVAVDRPGAEPSHTGEELWRALGVPADESCASAIRALQQAGFAVEQDAGVCLDGAALRFLRDHSAEPVAESARVALACALCTAVVRLSQRSQGIPDLLKRHLLEQRAQLQAQMVKTLAGGEPILATRTFMVLAALLQEARLAHEIGALAASLLESAGTPLYERGSPQLEAAWLSVAQRVPAARYRALLEAGASHFAEALLGGALRAPVPLVVQFLQSFYDQTGETARFRAVAHAAAEIYRAHRQPSLLLQQLSVLAAAEHVLGNTAERDRLERELLDAPCEACAESVELRRATLARVARMRIARHDDVAAEEVLQLLEQEQTPTGALDPIVVQLRADLAWGRQEWELAAQHFCTLWQAALRGTKGVDIDGVARRLAELKTKLGPGPFGALYAQHAGDDTPTPETLGVQPS